MSVRLKDIAADVGVSIVTVSKVLRNLGRVGPKTRARILKRTKELGYRPNLSAYSLATGRTFLIGLIVPDLMHPFFAAIAKCVSGSVRALGYSVVISSSEEDADLERQEIRSLLARRVDALVIASSQRRPAGRVFKEIEDDGVPYILLDRKIPGLKAHFVGVDDEAIGILATEHLIDRGYRRIAHIRGPELSTAEGRLRGYRRALRRHGYNGSERLIVRIGSSDDRGEECGFDAMQKLLAKRPRPDAVFCYNDIIAFAAMRAIRSAALNVPQDVAVIGVSNISKFSPWDTGKVPLSTIDQNVYRIGDQVAKLALRLIDSGAKAPIERILLPPTLVMRTST
jgi:LacI family transcriptional regulator